MNVLVILGHPRKDSYCASLAMAYIRGAKEAGTEVAYLILADMQFEMNVMVPSPQYQHQEDDLVKAQKLIKWADHLVFVFPTWWGNMPALLKAFLDRVLTPGFAFREIQPDAFDKLLSPRTAQLITTMDTPVLIDRLFNGAPVTKALTNATLKFCGVEPVRKMLLSPIKHSTEEKKQQWLHDVYQKGKALEGGLLTPWEKLKKKIIPWIQAIRLQFYPMTFFAYGMGAFAFSKLNGEFNLLVFIIGYVLLFLLEVMVVFSNDYYDRETDKLNRFYSPFSGGSRVLINGLISESAIKKAMRIVFVISCFMTVMVAFLSTTAFHQVVLMITALFLIAISYTAPPLKFSYNGWGEIVVGFTHSFAVILCGFVFQGGSMRVVFPWLLGIPLFLSIIPAIIMGGVPDRAADKQAGKGTLAVRLGKERAAYLAALFVLLSVISVLFLKKSDQLDEIYGNIIYVVIIHAIWLLSMLFKFIRTEKKPNRIDGIMAVALSYIMWFALVPFIKLT